MARYIKTCDGNRTPNTKCCICGKPKYRSPWRLKKYKEVYCESCISTHHKNNPEVYKNMITSQKINPYQLGKKFTINTRIKISLGHGGNGDLFFRKKIQKLRKLVEYKEWRLSVFKRDNFTCVICRKVGGKLNAHHLKSFSKYPESRFDINNGVTLCKICHKGVHKK